MTLRLSISFIVALFISFAIVLFMQRLIHSAPSDGIVKIPPTQVEIFQAPKDEAEPEDEAEPTPETEPLMDALQIDSTEPPAPSAEQSMPTLDLGSMDISTGFGDNPWNNPVAGKEIEKLLEQVGEDNQGFIEVTPVATRVPSVPQIAWENKINGWVLVAYNVTLEGLTENIRVLDANPRGVFEASVVAAVDDWLYKVSGVDNKLKQKLVLTQKIEVQWKNYPMNIPGY